jgi:hypothetical protein
MRRYTLVYRIQIGAVREANTNVCVLEPKAGIDIRSDLVVCPHDVFDVHVDKIIEGVDVLFDQTFDFQKCRQ